MHRTLLEYFAMTVVAAAAVGHASAQPLASVSLDTKAMVAGNIRTAVLPRVERARRTTAYGIVLDPGPLLDLSTQIATARSRLVAVHATATLARSEAARAAQLYRNRHNISLAALQAAEAQRQVAQARERTARARLVGIEAHARTDWGAVLAAAATSVDGALPALASGKRQLVEVSLPLGQSIQALPAKATAVTPGGRRVLLSVVSRAPRAAAGVAGPAFYYFMKAHDSAPIGTPLTVTLSRSDTVAGVLIPFSAVVWRDGRAFAYYQTGPGTFKPAPIRISSPSRDGYFVPPTDGAALNPGQRIVISGTALLFSASESAVSSAKAKAAKPQDDDDD